MPDILGVTSERHREMLEKLAEFCGLPAIKYEDHQGSGEEYTLYHMDGSSIVLRVAQDQCCGGFMIVDFGQSRLIAGTF